MVFDKRIELTHSTIFYSQMYEPNRTTTVDFPDYNNVYKFELSQSIMYT